MRLCSAFILRVYAPCSVRACMLRACVHAPCSVRCAPRSMRRLRRFASCSASFVRRACVVCVVLRLRASCVRRALRRSYIVRASFASCMRRACVVRCVVRALLRYMPAFVGIYGNLWELMGTCGNLWELVGVCGNSWELVGTYGNLWELMGTYGNLIIIIIIIIWFGDTVAVSHPTKCNTYSKVRALSWVR